MSTRTAKTSRWRAILALAVLCAVSPRAFAEGGNPVVVLETSLGTIRLELLAADAPKTVENFRKYVKSGFYDGTIFHRAIDSFVVQAGGYTADLKEKAPMFPPVPLESDNKLKNLRGTVAMARAADPNSGTSQFYINVVDNARLDYRDARSPGYAVFGKVISGMEVVQKIQVAKVVDKGGAFENLPEVPITIKTARLESDGK